MAARLRRDTQSLHDAVERQIPILNPAATVDTYRTYLLALCAFHLPVEQALTRVDVVSKLPVDLDQRRKVPPLLTDLERLGIDVTDPAAVPACDVVPAISDVRSALGCMYVLEGATLGGRVVYQQLSRRFPALMTTAARYLQGYGSDTRARWNEFGRALDARDQHEADDIVAGATDTFTALSAWIDLFARPRWALEGTT